jgi:hypothetical protein
MSSSARALCSVLAAGLAAAGPAGAAAKDFVLRVESDQEAAFTASCTVRTADGAGSTQEFAGKAPLTRTFQGKSLTCRIVQTSDEGGLLVEIVGSGGNVSRSRTGGRGSTITISMS